MRCLGTLEFLCDFHDRCHSTQKQLLNTKSLNHEENDVESDKENTLPLKKQKRKLKTSPVGNTNSTSSSASASLPEKDDKEKEKKIGNASENNQIQSATQIVAHSSTPISKGSIDLLSNRILKEKLPENQILCKNLKTEKASHGDDDVDIKPIIQSTRTGTVKACVNTADKNSMNKPEFHSMSLEFPVRRKKRGRKSKLEKMLELNHTLNLMLKRDAEENNSKTDTVQERSSRRKRQCLRRIDKNNENNPKEQGKNKRLVGNKENVNKVLQSSKNNICEKKEASVEKELVTFLEKTEDCTVKNKSVSVVVKQEKTDIDDTSSESSTRSSTLSPFVWIPNDMVLLKPEKPKIQAGVTNTSPPPGDEAEKNKIDENCTVPVLENRSPVQSLTLSMQESATSVSLSRDNHFNSIKCTVNNEIDIPRMQEDDCREVETITSNMDMSKRMQYDSSDGSFISRDDSFSDHAGKSRSSFGKISELISDEQKLAIETYYSIDMSRVNAEEVQKHLTVLDKNIRCNICGLFYLRMDKCQVHIWGHLKMRPYQCKACDFSTVTVSNVRCHIRKSHLKIKPFACQICEKRYVTAVLLEEHLNTHTGARPFKCKVCNFASASRQMLSYHNATHKVVKDINCKVCGKEFYSKSRLRAHMLIHNKDKSVMCKICSAYLSNPEALEMHHKNVHMRDYICNVCGKHVKSRKALHNHQNVHAAAKYKCSLCPNVYKSSQILKEHLLKHEGIRKYKCIVCEKSFAQQSHLAAHMAVHSTIRYHCPGCNKAFNRHDNMKIHTKRCKEFLAKPELKKLLLRREKSLSLRGKKEAEDTSIMNALNLVPYIRMEEEDAQTKSAEENDKTELILSKIEVNISTIESENVWNENEDTHDPKDINKSMELEVIPIEDLHSLTPGNDNISIRENVLRPESY